MALDPVTHKASLTVNWNLPLGSHVIKAYYLGDPNFAPAFTAPGFSLKVITGP